MDYQNRRSGRYRPRPVPRIVFRIYVLLWIIPIIFFLSAPTVIGFLVALCIAITILIMMATWQKPRGAGSTRQVYQAPSHDSFPLARLKQPSPSRWSGDLQDGKFARYDDYEQPQAQYPGQRP